MSAVKRFTLGFRVENKAFRMESLRAEFINDDETPGDVNLVSVAATFC